MSRVELLGENEKGLIVHLNCEGGGDWLADNTPETVKDSWGNGVLDIDEAGKDVSYCFTCGMVWPEEVCESFEPMEDGLEKEDKPYSGTGGYDPPLWMFDGLEWRMS